MSGGFQQAFQYSPYQTASVVAADSFKTTSETSYIRYNPHTVARSAQLTHITSLALRKQNNQIASPYQTQQTAKDRERHLIIKTSWEQKHFGKKTLPPLKGKGSESTGAVGDQSSASAAAAAALNS